MYITYLESLNIFRSHALNEFLDFHVSASPVSGSAFVVIGSFDWPFSVM